MGNCLRNSTLIKTVLLMHNAWPLFPLSNHHTRVTFFFGNRGAITLFIEARHFCSKLQLFLH